MCGILGHFSSTGFNDSDKANFDNMLLSLRHRGPDNYDTWISPNNDLILGHTRLSILDLSILGNQPMVSQSSRYVISYNGEIYNHLKLRDELKKSKNSWKGSSDTETLLACIDSWGLYKTLNQIEGMFAFGLLDLLHNKLFLCRDRFGEKPLFFGNIKNSDENFIFSSEINSFLKHPDFRDELNYNGISELLKVNNIGGDKTIYKSINKLLPGYTLEYDLNSKSKILKQYWSAHSVAIQSAKRGYNSGFYQAAEDTKALLESIINDQMTSDVPIGCFLSGGIDSSLVASIMQSQSTKPINTFTIGSKFLDVDEASNAKKIANYLGTNHTELYLDSSDLIKIVPKALEIYGEPFADSSQIPTLLVSQLAKSKVSVALSGDAGDEIFGGYNRYVFMQKYWKTLSLFPPILRRFTSLVGTKNHNLLLNILLKLNFGSNVEHLDLKLQKFLYAIKCKNELELYDSFITSNGYKRCINNDLYIDNSIEINIDGFESFEQMMLADTISYLPNDILTKVDRAAMSVSLETRAPFLNHKLYELLWSFPAEYKVNKGITKLIAREINSSFIPKNLLAQPKTGFGLPLHDFIRNELKVYVRDLIFSSKVTDLDIICKKNLDLVWKNHQDKVEDNTSFLWSLTALGAWLEKTSR